MLARTDIPAQAGTGSAEAESRPPRDDTLVNRVRRVLLANRREGYSQLLGRHYCYIAPSPRSYPFQWFWDTCFHVIMLTRIGEHDLAKSNLRCLFEMQNPDGFVGHMIFWNQLLPKRRSDVLQALPNWTALRPHMSSLIQPAFVAAVLLRVFEAGGDRVFLGEMYAKIKRYHEWLACSRDFDDDGLLTIITPFESGMDWKPSYDEVLGYQQRVTPGSLYFNSLYWRGVNVDLSNFLLRYELNQIRRQGKFLVKDVGVNVIYAGDLAAMEKLATLIGDDPLPYRNRRSRLVQSMMKKMYDETECAFYDVARNERKLRVPTPTMLFPLMLDDLPDDIAERVIERHCGSGGLFDANYPVCSVARDDPSFFAGESPFIWRGPMWSFNNWFLFHALMRRGQAALAGRLRDALRRAVEKSGFREYYDPFTGQGYGAQDFTWPGLLVDMNDDAAYAAASFGGNKQTV